MSALTTLLDNFRKHARTEREKGTYFEELTRGYPLSLLLRVVNVSLKTVAIVNALPTLEIHEQG